ncbi:MAG: hypothetical protein JNJ83_01820 [Verrucomicrobiaceae bacterium]|nr:hypothetical protein [Verrucomicrobiaceae bacterium]
MNTNYHNHAHFQSTSEQNAAESTNSPPTNTYLRDPKEIAEEVLGSIEWLDERTGFGTCPGRAKHTTPDGPKDCRIHIDGTPTVHCLHASCTSDVTDASRRLRDEMNAYPVRSIAATPPAPTTKSTHIKGREHELGKLASETLPIILKDHACTIDGLRAQSRHFSSFPPIEELSYLTLLQMVYGREAVIWIGDKYDSGSPDHAKHWRTIAEWREDPGPNLGPYVCTSTFKPGAFERSNHQIAKRGFFVVECDAIDEIVATKLAAKEDLTHEDKRRNKDLSVAILLWLRDAVGLRLRAVVDSGNKSIHGHFEMPPDDVRQELEVILPALKCDPAAWRPSQPVRMPGYTSESGRSQRLIFVDAKGDNPQPMRLPSEALREIVGIQEVTSSQMRQELVETMYNAASIGREPPNSFSSSGTTSCEGDPQRLVHGGLSDSSSACERANDQTTNSSNSYVPEDGCGDSASTASSGSSPGPERSGEPSTNSFTSSFPAHSYEPSSASSSSNSSPHPFDFPASLRPEAFHGVAGQIVRMIEPHTEADPAALLVQFLAAIGNIVGRNVWIRADGARHHLNLFATVVGSTSKGRKGTSWSQIERIVGELDEVWTKDRITNGFSSGEGLIDEVRDPVVERKPAKGPLAKPGETEEIIKDNGVADKRLMVVEGEFVNALKVMDRLGNTLSPVIRQAWDGRTLNTMVKNSKSRCAAPHITIVGHITREELLSSLGRTEIANGFANRFLWVAAKRSKILPEGGDIDTVDFGRVINCLRSVIDFAQTVGEVRRAEVTRELWHADYIQLSEGKPGMVGSITGRAEAQVMRLSVLYAVLDRSKVILPVHHHAAMAVWKYCEDTVRWLFGNRTGDKNADKILSALRNGRDAGLSRTDISVDVFARNLPAHDLHEALQKLAEFDFAHKRRVPTRTGATEERWFYGSAPPM